MKLVFSKQFLFSGILLLFFFSCIEEKETTFHKDISYQQLLNKTESFSQENVDIYKIRYTSDELIIEGFIAKPKSSKNKLPAIIFCRGGNQSFGMLNTYQLQMINDLATRGFVVLASQLRGNISSEGIDEFGGKDVNDILKLIDIARELDFIEAQNINVLGYSRGGMNTYQVSKLTDAINSIAVVGSPTNKFKGAKFRESMYQYVYKPLFGDSIQNKDEYVKRSAIYWSNKINEPTLILHGNDDQRVAVEEAKQIVDSFTKRNKVDFQFKFFQKGNHSLSNFSAERDSLIINWFKTHNK